MTFFRYHFPPSGPESLKADNTQGQDRFGFNANVSDRDLEAYFYPPFEACIDRNRGNSKGAMCSDAAQVRQFLAILAFILTHQFLPDSRSHPCAS